MIPGAEIGDLVDETSTDAETGAVTSRQAADIVLPAEALAGLWDPEHLERVARTYWTTLQRFSLGLIHVHYTAGERAVVFLIPQLRLLTFKAPEYEMDECHGIVRWRIKKGLLVSSRGTDGDGYLEIDIQRHDEADRGQGAAPRRGRGRQLLPPPRRALAAALLGDPVAHPRDLLQLLPPPARAARPLRLQGRPLRRPRLAEQAPDPS